jgi:hypothetical protein
MRFFIFLMTLFFFTSCTTTELLDSWKRPDIYSYLPYKVLVVGMTSNTKARIKFEQHVKDELELRGIDATMSLDLFDASLRTPSYLILLFSTF